MPELRRLAAPPKHGDALVVPEPCSWRRLARANADRLNSSDLPVAGATLGEWRRRTREQLADSGDVSLILLGHQPEFIHPGVWAKHIVAGRVAEAYRGRAIQLVVDSDVPKSTSLLCPHVGPHGLTVAAVPFLTGKPNLPYEHHPAWNRDQLHSLATRVGEAMEASYAGSQMPNFFDGMKSCGPGADGVDQLVGGRRRIESLFGVTLNDLRVSMAPWSPLFFEVVTRSRPFTAAYNQAIAEYRRRFNVRGVGRPIPALQHYEHRVELPIWAYRPGEPRRRLFVEHRGDRIRLSAEALPIHEWSAMRFADEMRRNLVSPAWGEWRFRPRALLLTLWARVFVADLFIHGIGGARYDGITDEIVHRFFGVEPPEYVCVSATLHLGLPTEGSGGRSASEVRQALRDLRWNPQRFARAEGDAAVWAAKKSDALRQSILLRETSPHDHAARTKAFHAHRQSLDGLRSFCADRTAELDRELAAALFAERQNRLAQGREYFFGLFDSPRLDLLMDRLPAARAFEV